MFGATRKIVTVYLCRCVSWSVFMREGDIVIDGISEKKHVEIREM